MKNSYQDSSAYITRDGSEIRELMHPAGMKGKPGSVSSQQQSLAEAIVKPGQLTQLHRHIKSEELYHVTSGTGLMTLADEKFDVTSGDTICIPPGTAHCIENTGTDDLLILCCCSPAYSHEDTELL